MTEVAARFYQLHLSEHRPPQIFVGRGTPSADALAVGDVREIGENLTFQIDSSTRNV
jgi:hypothetical protein